MLTLLLRIDEQLLVGDDILVEFHEISGEQVRLGVAAPEEEGGDFQWTAVPAKWTWSPSLVHKASSRENDRLDESARRPPNGHDASRIAR